MYGGGALQPLSKRQRELEPLPFVQRGDLP